MVIRQLLLTLAFFFSFYLFELGVTYLVFQDKTTVIDTRVAGGELFWDSPRKVAYGASKLRSLNRKIVFIGASNVRDGFRSNILETAFPNTEMHCLCVGGSAIGEFRDMLQLTLANTPEQSHNKLLFVIGIWFGSFRDMEEGNIGRGSIIEAELLRFGLYIIDKEGVVTPRFSRNQTDILIEGARPLFFALFIRQQLNILMSRLRIPEVKDRLKQYLLGSPKEKHLNDQTVTIANLKGAVGSVNSWSQLPFKILRDIVSSTVSADAKVMLVDLPLQPWVRDAMPYDRVYQDRLSRLLDELMPIENFEYVSLRGTFNDEDFVDFAHPTEKTAAIWTARIIPHLKRAMGDD
jgi:hypothetical protein